MAETFLHLDADTSMKTLQHVLQQRGHDVTRTPTEWMSLDASDERQLLGAAAHGRVIFTFNIGDFLHLARLYPEHHGILVVNQRNWRLSTLIEALGRMLNETSAADWVGQVRWLNDWRT